MVQTKLAVITEYLRDYVLNRSSDLDKIMIDVAIYRAIKTGLFTLNEWRMTFDYLCAPQETNITVERVLSILSVCLDKEPEQFIHQYCLVDPHSKIGMQYLARLYAIEGFL